MAHSLKQTLSQQMKLTPQQVMLSSLLQLPLLALEQKLKQEIELNPLLEESLELDTEPELEQEEKPELKTEEERPDNPSEELSLEKTLQEKALAEDKEIDWGEVLNDDRHFEARAPRDPSPDEETDWTPPSRITLADYLLEQLRFTALTEPEKEIGEYIIWNINEVGYLVYNDTSETARDIESFSSHSTDDGVLIADENTVHEYGKPAEEIPEQTALSTSSGKNHDPAFSVAADLNADPQKVLMVLEIIQTFDPPGIAARNLRECLLIQLRQRLKGYYDSGTSVSVRIIEEAYDDFIHRRYDKIQKQLQLNPAELKPAILEILSLNPKPGEGYVVPEQNYIVPDLIVRRVHDDLEILLNDHSVPHLRINHAYRRMMMEKSKTDRDAREFLKNKLESAKWLINSLYRRRDTIRRTMQAIADIQKEFFIRGTEFLKPMKLEDVAKIIQMDISTVSRATNGKYVQTDYGIFELKYFFSTGMASSDGDDVSTRQIKDTLRSIIETEDKAHPLSDDELAQELGKKGFPIARRTVAKYREQIRIPAARFRKAL